MRRVHLVTSCLLFAVLCLGGCVLAPYHGQVFDSTSSPVELGGCYPKANELIEIQYCGEGACWNPRVMFTAYTVPVNFTDQNNISWSCVYIQTPLPSYAWVWNKNINKYQSYLRFYAPGSRQALRTYSNPPQQCPLPHGSPQIVPALGGDPLCASDDFGNVLRIFANGNPPR